MNEAGRTYFSGGVIVLIIDQKTLFECELNITGD